MIYAYDAPEVESRWQSRWAEEHAYEVANDDPRPPFYVLCMYPYPSGAAHQGHVRNYTFGDLNVRWRTMQGCSVLSPIGFDSFGLPAENAAIKTGTHPRSSPRPASPSCRARCAAWAPATTGGGSCAATTPSTCASTRSSSCASWRPGWPTGRRRPSTGARVAPRCWPTSRCGRTGRASAAATWWSKKTWNSGSSASPPTPTSCWPPSPTWSGPSGSRRCSATGSAAPRVPSSRWRSPAPTSVSRCSPPDPTPASA